MTTTSTAQTLPRVPESAAAARRQSATAAVASYAMAAAFTIPDAHGLREVAIVLVGAALVSLVVYGWVVPRGMVKGAPATALGLSVVAALLLLPAFWSMLPLLLGVAGIMLGRSSIGFAPKRSYAAVGLGAVAVAGYLFLYLVLGLVMDDL